MSDERTPTPVPPERRVLTRTSICQIESDGAEVTVQIGRVMVLLSPTELAALSGSCRSATRQLFPRRPRREAPYLRLVTCDDDEVASP